jgi:hypothetical protein
MRILLNCAKVDIGLNQTGDKLQRDLSVYSRISTKVKSDQNFDEIMRIYNEYINCNQKKSR